MSPASTSTVIFDDREHHFPATPTVAQAEAFLALVALRQRLMADGQLDIMRLAPDDVLVLAGSLSRLYGVRASVLYGRPPHELLPLLAHVSTVGQARMADYIGGTLAPAIEALTRSAQAATAPVSRDTGA